MGQAIAASFSAFLVAEMAVANRKNDACEPVVFVVPSPHYFGGKHKMKNYFALVGTLALVSGCATNPKDIAPAYVSPVLYQNLSCQQLAAEASRVSAAAAAASGAQKSQAGKDAAMVGVSLVLFWPALFFVGGDKTNAAEVARLKGEMKAIEEANRTNNCGIAFAAAG